MTQPFAAPTTGARGEVSSLLTLLLIACLVLGGLGFASTLWGLVTIAMGASPELFGLDAEQARIVREAQQAQPWWAVTVTAAFHVLKLGLAGGLVAGAIATMAGRLPGRVWLERVLVFGIVFELGFWLYSVVNTGVNRDRMAEQFGRGMQADPNLSPELAEAAGRMFGQMMVLGMVLLFGWVLVKVGLYAYTRRVLRRELPVAAP